MSKYWAIASGENRVRWLWASGHNLFIDPLIQHLGLCVFLFKYTSLNIHRWPINVALLASSTATRAWAKLVRLTYVPRMHIPPSCAQELHTAPQHHAQGPLWTVTSSKKKSKMLKNVALNITKRTLVYNMGTGTKRQNIASVDLVPIRTQSLSSAHCASDHGRATILIWGLQRNFSKEANLQIWNPPIWGLTVLVF